MRRKITVLLIAFFCIAASTAIHPCKAVAEKELIVSAAASLTNAFKEAAEKFQAANPGLKITSNFGASGALLQQMAQGAPVDIFASADQKTMDEAAAKRLILLETRKNFVSNKLVLIVPADSKPPIKGLKDLTGEAVSRIAIGNPASVPAGRYAQAAMTKEGLWETLSPKFINAESVRQALDYVSRGEVDAGIVFSTDAAIAKDKVRVVASLESGEPILYPIAVVSGTGDKEAAGRFIEYVLSVAGQEILAKYGFGKP